MNALSQTPPPTTKAQVNDALKSCISIHLDDATRAAPDDLFAAIMDCEARVQDALEAKARHHIKSLNADGDISRFKSLMTAFCVRIAASVADGTLAWGDGAYWVTRYAMMLPPFRADMAEEILQNLLAKPDAELIRQNAAHRAAEEAAIRVTARQMFEGQYSKLAIKKAAMEIAQHLDEEAVKVILRDQQSKYEQGLAHISSLKPEATAA